MKPAARAYSGGVVLAICYAGFVSLGLPDTLIGVAWPSVRDTFGLQQSEVSWIFLGSGCSYFLSSFFAGRLLKLWNVGALLAVSSSLVALSGLNFGLATVWPWFALGALLHGLGSGAIDSGLNHYVATHFSVRHMNWLHASYSLGAMLGPVIMTTCITRADNWRLGYLIVASTLLLLALLFFSTTSRWAAPPAVSQSGKEDANPDAETDESLYEPPDLPPSEAPQGRPALANATSALRHRMVQLNVVLFFLYTGLEVAIGQWSFTVLTESRGVEEAIAGGWVSLYWASILAGRILFGFIVDRISIDLLLRLSLCTVVASAALFASNAFPESAPLALAVCGLGLAVVFPCLMTRTPKRVGKDLAAHAIGFQVGAAMLGAAALPSICGVIAQRGGLQLIAPTLVVTAATLLLLHEVQLYSVRRNEQPRPSR